MVKVSSVFLWSWEHLVITTLPALFYHDHKSKQDNGVQTANSIQLSILLLAFSNSFDCMEAFEHVGKSSCVCPEGVTSQPLGTKRHSLGFVCDMTTEMLFLKSQTSLSACALTLDGCCVCVLVHWTSRYKHWPRGCASLLWALDWFYC